MGNENSTLNFTAKPSKDPFGSNYDDLVQQAENEYYENYCGVTLDHSDDISQSFTQ